MLPGICIRGFRSLSAVLLFVLIVIMTASHARQAFPRAARLAFALTHPVVRAVRTTPSSRTFTASRPGWCAMTASTQRTAQAVPPKEISGPTWVLDYDALDAPELLADIESAVTEIAGIDAVSRPVKEIVSEAGELSLQSAKDSGVLDALVTMHERLWRASTLLRNAGTYAGCVSSVDATNEGAKKLTGKIQELFSKARQAYEPAALVLDLCPNDLVEAFLDSNDETKASTYLVKHSRQMKAHKLSLAEENMVTALGVTGHSAWGSLYTDLSSVIPVRVKQPDGSSKSMGVASAAALLDSPSEGVRRTVWEGIRDAWLPHQETCAAVLNAITGWRLDMYAKRNYDSFLVSSLHSGHMSKKSLDAMLTAVDKSAEVGRRALRVQAQALGKEKLDIWDLLAPAPVSSDTGKTYSFEEGIELIANAVAAVDEEAGSFVRMCAEKKWIEASRGPSKRPGAYCTGFAVSRNPRVYLSDYNGRATLLSTLAHELGHAWHNWVMRDMPRQQSSYPMNLAETASIFFETVVSKALLEQAETTEEKLSIMWNEGESAATFLLNIPARFRFEEELNERRAEGKLSAPEIDTMMVNAWKRYYGDSVQNLERVGVFSQSKLHFYLTGISFYNWPYTFGTLLSAGVYAEYEKAGNKATFSEMYRNLLRDTGRMDAEDVVEKHLGGRIDDELFWRNAIDILEGKVSQFERVVKELAAERAG